MNDESSIQYQRGKQAYRMTTFERQQTNRMRQQVGEEQRESVCVRERRVLESLRCYGVNGTAVAEARLELKAADAITLCE